MTVMTEAAKPDAVQPEQASIPPVPEQAPAVIYESASDGNTVGVWDKIKGFCTKAYTIDEKA